MAEVFRTRDVVVFMKGDAFPVALNATLLSQGWAGGQGVQWADSPHDEFLVERSTGRYGGFLLWGSDEDSDRLTAITGYQVISGHGVLCAGGWVIATRTYEKYTWASRQSGPLVENVFTPGQRLVFSLRGLWTPEDEWTLASDPRAPNDFFTANVVRAPSAETNGFVTLQTSI